MIKEINFSAWLPCPYDVSYVIQKISTSSHCHDCSEPIQTDPQFRKSHAKEPILSFVEENETRKPKRDTEFVLVQQLILSVTVTSYKWTNHKKQVKYTKYFNCSVVISALVFDHPLFNGHNHLWRTFEIFMRCFLPTLINQSKPVNWPDPLSVTVWMIDDVFY